MSRVLVIGCGGVASVAIHKICQVSEVFSDLCIASRTVSKCDKLADELKGKTSTNITTAKVDADNTDEVIALINEFKPDVVLNVALPYQDLTIMDACLACKVPYVDTANYECEDTDNPEWRKVYEERCKRLGFTAYFDYSWQWAYREKYKEAGITAMLTDVVALRVPHATGSLNKAMHQIVDGEVNIEYMYAFANGADAAAVLKSDDPGRVIDILKGSGFDVYSADEAYRANQ